jgi:hypothetical protein
VASTLTTVPVKSDTLRRLRGYKAGGASYDQVLNDLMDDILPESFLNEHLRRLREEETVEWDLVRAPLKL